MRDKWLSGLSYCLGEKKDNYTNISGLENILAEHKLPYIPEILGLGDFYKTDDIYSLLTKSIGNTLGQSSISEQEIDCIIFSSSNFSHDFLKQNLGYSTSFIKLGINPKSLYCVSGTGCVSFFSACELANSLIESEGFKRVLIVNIDYEEIVDDRARFVGYAILSDSVTSVILSREMETPGDFRILSFRKTINVEHMNKRININNNGMVSDVIKLICDDSKIALTDLTRVFSNNIFLSVKVMKEMALGFCKEQLYLENISRTGHCLTSDPLINMSDYLNQTTDTTGLYLLYSEADGHASSLLLSI